MSLAHRLKANGYAELAAEIDPAVVADIPVEEVAVVVEPEVAAERIAVAEARVEAITEDNEISVEIRGGLDEVDAIRIQIATDDQVGEDLAAASEEMTDVVLSTEAYMKEGGMHAQTAQERLKHLQRIAKVVGFEMNPTLPSFESFGSIGTRLENTGLVYEEEQNWLKKIWATLKGWLKTAYDNVSKFMDKVFTVAGRLKERASKLKARCGSLSGTPKAAKVKVSAGEIGLIGSGNIKGQAAAVNTAFNAGWDAAEQRALTFSASVVAALNGSSSDKVADVKVPAIKPVTFPGNYGFKSEGDSVTFGDVNTGGTSSDAEWQVSSPADLASAADSVVSLAESLQSVKGDIGKSNKAYKDAVAAGDKLQSKVDSAPGKITDENRKKISGMLNRLKDVRAAFTQPGTDVVKWGGKAGGACLDIINRMANQYGAPVKEEKESGEAAAA